MVIGYGENPRLYATYDKNLTNRLEARLAEVPIESDFTDNAVSVLNKRYFKKDDKGVAQEDVYGLFKRVASFIAYPDFNYNDVETATETAKTFYKMMMNREFIPNSPTLMNAGRKLQQLAACFVLPIEDDMESILMGVYYTGMIHKSGGGTGFSFSKLRRKNDFVSTTYGKASGPVSFIMMYDSATQSVNQGGFRRGANMGIKRCDHPDILEFISSKQNEKDRRYGNFNFSVAITDDFMKCLETGEHYVLKNPKKGKNYELTIDDLKQEEISVELGLITNNERVLIIKGDDVFYQNPVERDIRERIKKVEKKKVGRVDDKGRITLSANAVIDQVAQLAWKNGEPGVAFIDLINKYNPTPNLGEIESTNPCGEQPLLPMEACNLGSINLERFVINDNGNWKINYEGLRDCIYNSVQFLDNTIDMCKYPLEKPKTFTNDLIEVLEKKITDPEIRKSILDEWSQSPIEKMVLGNRKIGLGVMGFAEMLYNLRIPYNSQEAVEKAEEVMKFIQEKSIEKSQELAEKKGAFPNFSDSIFAEEKPRRNATCTTIAPTGTISIIAGASSAIEPLFAFIYEHTDADGQKRYFKNEILEKRLIEEGIDADKVFEDMITKYDDNKKIIQKGKTLQELDYVPENIKKVFVISEDVSVDYHVKHQAAFQKYTDNAVSKTINLPNNATVEDVKKAYLMAYETGCKGITVYREGSRDEEVLRKQRGGLEKVFHYTTPRKRPEKLPGETIKKETGCGNIFVTMNYTQREDGTKDLFEVFAEMGKAGGCASCQNEATGRLTSHLLRSMADPKAVASQLIGIRCHKPIGLGENAVYSCADAIGKAIAEFYGEKIEAPIGDSEDFENLIDNSKEKSTREDIKNGMLNSDPSIVGGGCPACGSSMQIKDGCVGGVCSNPTCGFSECG